MSVTRFSGPETTSRLWSILGCHTFRRLRLYGHVRRHFGSKKSQLNLSVTKLARIGDRRRSHHTVNCHFGYR
ncbi:hypothetical protein F383_37977 [Gossypium arboreum]|uniref:Uncharacterized protein n=1 Tax=Gossypium arboreum TaxID=29729 RepID=A0A0B0MJ17_GOSAR|nr:hypothetical protein F383_37977 [Gossypium arboreum]